MQINNTTIQKAFRKMAVKHHPNKGGDEEQFKKLSHTRNKALEKLKFIQEIYKRRSTTRKKRKNRKTRRRS
jgi:curved DNA-binding protein CbpA